MRWIWSVMKTKVVYGPFRNAMRAADGSEVQLERELFLLLPRMLLRWCPRGGLISKSFASERVGFSLVRASEQCDELSLGFSTGENKEVTDKVQGPVWPTCCPNAYPSVPCRVSTSPVLCIFRCTPAGVAAKSTSLATTEHCSRRVGAKRVSWLVMIIGTSSPVSICQIHDSCAPRRETIERPSDTFWCSGGISSDTGRLHQFGKKVPLGMLLGCALGDRGGVNLERRNFWSHALRPGRVRNPSSKTQCKRSVDVTQG